MEIISVDFFEGIDIFEIAEVAEKAERKGH